MAVRTNQLPIPMITTSTRAAVGVAETTTVVNLATYPLSLLDTLPTNGLAWPSSRTFLSSITNDRASHSAANIAPVEGACKTAKLFMVGDA